MSVVGGVAVILVVCGVGGVCVGGVSVVELVGVLS